MGLKGILQTNTLWATHFSKLSDASEIMLLSEPLEKALTERAKSLIIELQKRVLASNDACKNTAVLKPSRKSKQKNWCGRITLSP